MILQALVEYYERRAADPDPARRLPAFGWEYKEIPFVIELLADGRVSQLVDTRQSDGERLRGRRYLVPQGEKKTSGVKANLLWDSAEYVIGLPRTRKAQGGPSPPEAFAEQIAGLPEPARSDAGLVATVAALRRNDWGILTTREAWPVIVETNPVMSFRLAGDEDLVCQRPAVAAALVGRTESPNETEGLCLVAGRIGPIARLHPAIKGIRGAHVSGANIVSFNARAFESYGKTERQGENAPISTRAAFAYTTALNHLLAHGSRNRAQLGDASTVFWADRPSRFDGEFTLADFFDDFDDPDRNVRAVQALFEAVQSGLLSSTEGETHFFVLGMAPNASRISIRFWLNAPLIVLAPRIAQHFRDLAIVRQFDSDPLTPSLSRLLRTLAVQGKLDNVPPRVAGEWIRAILEGAPYPATLFNAAVLRCRAEQAVDSSAGNVPYLRAAVLKACINRTHRRRYGLSDDFCFIRETLDVTQSDPAYRLGRLFAVLERIQSRAQSRVNATIRDRYYGAASTSPATVFPTLLRLKNAHLKKLGDGEVGYFERLVGEVCGSLNEPLVAEFPRQLGLFEQGLFALGYYHQRQSFFARKADAPDVHAAEESR